MIRANLNNKNDQRIRRATKTRAKIADSGNHRIRKIGRDNNVRTIAGVGT